MYVYVLEYVFKYSRHITYVIFQEGNMYQHRITEPPLSRRYLEMYQHHIYIYICIYTYTNYMYFLNIHIISTYYLNILYLHNIFTYLHIIFIYSNYIYIYSLYIIYIYIYIIYIYIHIYINTICTSQTMQIPFKSCFVWKYGTPKPKSNYPLLLFSDHNFASAIPNVSWPFLNPCLV